MGNNNDIKLCIICGDRATGYNFNAVCCESCKAFFRRNAFKYEEFKCYFGNNCRIDLVSRKYCKKCRMKKCFDLGMKKEWILNDEQKNIRRNKIEENRRKRKNSSNDSVNNSSSDSSSTQFTDQMRKIPSKERARNQKTMHNKTNANSVYEKRVELEMSVIPVGRPINPLTDKLNDIEMNRLTQLFKIMHIFKSPMVAIRSETMTEEDICDAFRNNCEEDILKIIKISKCMESFHKLCQNDQIALVKYGGMEVHFLRLATHYDFDNEYCTSVTDDCTSIVLMVEPLQQCHRFLYKTLMHFLAKIKPEWEKDSIILDILTAVILFNPDRPHLLYREMVKLQQHIYMYLLHRYLLTRYPTKYESNTKFMRLLGALIDLNIVRESHVQHCKDLEPQRMSPLLREICDYNIVAIDGFNEAVVNSSVK